jgi:hypothetical protein|tara:strand:- start:11660 stop:11938 length:279 start_codon:yes stop_codon:yes gene_type:complete
MSSSEHYFRDCKYCGISLKMMKADGKWGAYEVNGNAHKCQKSGYKGPQTTKKVYGKSDNITNNAELESIIDDIDRMHKILNNLQDRLEDALK